MLETESRPAGGIDFNDAGNSERIGICTRGFCGRARRRGSSLEGAWRLKARPVSRMRRSASACTSRCTVSDLRVREAVRR